MRPCLLFGLVGLLISSLLITAAKPAAMAQASVQGQWSTAPNLMPINPIHVALLPNGKLLIVAGSGNCPPSQSGCPSGPPYDQANGSGALIWDPLIENYSQWFSTSWDMFCNGMVLLKDGRALINGGTIEYNPFYGAANSSIFDPGTNTFTAVANMAHGRWYPTVLTLGDGRVMTFSGFNETGGTNTAVEFYTVDGGWSTQYFASWTPDLYPRLHLLPNGKVFYSGAQTTSKMFDPSTETWTTNIATTNYGNPRTYGTSILLPLTPANNYDPKIMVMGGHDPATNTTEIIDLGMAMPAWVYGPNMSQPRIEMNAVILPNGEILAVGGSLIDEDTATASTNADLYDPATNTFSPAGTNAYPHLYHSVALLLPDATVWLAGSNPQRGSYTKQVEIYKPAYLFNSDGSAATRPSITGTPSSISYGRSFTVSSPDAANISSVVLIRNPTVTHSFAMDEREVALSYKVEGGLLTVTAPPNGNIAPPGYYMLFLLNRSGVPSVATFVHVDAPGATGTLPAPTNLTATAGNGQVGLSWSGSSGATSYNVKRSPTSGGPYTTIASPAGTSYTDTSVTNGTTYYYVVSAMNGEEESPNSSQVSETPTAGRTVINYSGAFSASGLQLNGSATLSGTGLRLTNGGISQASSVFYTTAVNVQSFTTNFSFQMTSASADGMAFVIQNNGLTALGPSGGGLGYGPDSLERAPYAGMSKSVAVKFDIYSNSGESTDSTGLYTDGTSPTTPAVDMTSSGVTLLSGDVMNVQLSYNGTTLTLTITDASTLKSFTTNWTVNIPMTVGGNTALVGFTGSTGDLTAIQDILSWTLRE